MIIFLAIALRVLFCLGLLICLAVISMWFDGFNCLSAWRNKTHIAGAGCVPNRTRRPKSPLGHAAVKFPAALKPIPDEARKRRAMLLKIGEVLK